MRLEEEILTLKTLVSSLLERVSQLDAENTELRLENIVLQKENLTLKTRLDKTLLIHINHLQARVTVKSPPFPKSVPVALVVKSVIREKPLK